MLARLDPSMVLEKRQQSIFLFEDFVSLDHPIFVRTQYVYISFKRYVYLLCFLLGLGGASRVYLCIMVKFLKKTFLTAISHQIL